MIVGDTHWESHSASTGSPPGPQPDLPVRPGPDRQASPGVGPRRLRTGRVEGMGPILPWTDGWLTCASIRAVAVESAYRALLDGRVDPRVGEVCHRCRRHHPVPPGMAGTRTDGDAGPDGSLRPPWPPPPPTTRSPRCRRTPRAVPVQPAGSRWSAATGRTVANYDGSATARPWSRPCSTSTATATSARAPRRSPPGPGSRPARCSATSTTWTT